MSERQGAVLPVGLAASAACPCCSTHGPQPYPAFVASVSAPTSCQALSSPGQYFGSSCAETLYHKISSCAVTGNRLGHPHSLQAQVMCLGHSRALSVMRPREHLA